MAFKDRLYDVPVVGTAMRVQDRYREDAGDQFAGAIGFFGFLSLFPLLLLALATVGFVLADASDQRLLEIAGTIQDAIPGFSAVLGEGDTGIANALEGIIENAGAVAGIGAVTTLLSGLRIVNSAQTATLVIFRVDLLAISGVRRKVQQVVALVVLGLLATAGVVAAGSLGFIEELRLFGIMEVVAPVLVWLGTYALDVGLFLVAYRLFSTADGPPWRRLLPGALFAGLGWTVLKGFGATWVSEQVASASELYGALGGVIGLLLLLYLAGRLYVYGAELSAVLSPELPNASTEPELAAEDVDEAAAAGSVGAPPVAAGAPLFTVHPANRPEPGTSTTEAAMLAPSASDATRARLAARPEPTAEEGQGRHALAFAVAVGAVAGLVGILRPWGDD